MATDTDCDQSTGGRRQRPPRRWRLVPWKDAVVVIVGMTEGSGGESGDGDVGDAVLGVSASSLSGPLVVVGMVVVAARRERDVSPRRRLPAGNSHRSAVTAEWRSLVTLTPLHSRVGDHFNRPDRDGRLRRINPG